MSMQPLCRVRCSQVPGLRPWTSLGSRFPAATLSSAVLVTSCHLEVELCRSHCVRAWPGHFTHPQVSGYPGPHGVTAMAGSIYPGQASLLDQTDSWNHRPQEIPMWQPSMEVNWMSLGFALLIDEAVPKAPFILNPKISRFRWPDSKIRCSLGLWIFLTKRWRDATIISPFIWKTEPYMRPVDIQNLQLSRPC